MSRNEGDPLVAFIGNAFMAIGVMLITVCGTCTAIFGIPLLLDLAKGGGSDPYDIGLVTGVFGLIATAIGFGFFLGGRSLKRSAGRRPTIR